ncbi:MAG TPA: bifunctional precorrin-2 dehydrogenase/sirohydrochlorin ferrochelatase [Polyangia bacterium]|nr:bifunctional precorrin-2 dehydrogenase/sirohydrochlorin ferrochelatase [Polyangia bacterium]
MDKSEALLFPLFLKLAGRSVLLVGGGPVATAKARALADAGAEVTVVSPELTAELAALAAARAWQLHRRAFEATDLNQSWLAIAAAPPVVNAEVSAAAAERRIFVVAVDDPPSATAYGAGIVRRAGVTLAVSTAGHAPALAGLLREGLDALLPTDLGVWMSEAERLRTLWRAGGVPLPDRRPQLLRALNRLYVDAAEPAHG